MSCMSCRFGWLEQAVGMIPASYWLGSLSFFTFFFLDHFFFRVLCCDRVENLYCGTFRYRQVPWVVRCFLALPVLHDSCE